MFFCPTQVLDRAYGPECDLWSCGVVLYILLCGYPPFWGDRDQEIFRKVRRGHVSFEGPEWQDVSDQAKHLIRCMLTVDPKRRYGVANPLTQQSLCATVTHLVPVNLCGCRCWVSVLGVGVGVWHTQYLGRRSPAAPVDHDKRRSRAHVDQQAVLQCVAPSGCCCARLLFFALNPCTHTPVSWVVLMHARAAATVHLVHQAQAAGFDSHREQPARR